MKSLRIAFLIWFCIASVSVSAQPDRKVTPEQAKTLVLEALSHRERSLPKVGAEQYAPPKPSRFLFFTVLWEGKPGGSVVIGNFAVDPYTGDVWSATSSCKEETNKRLAALQKEIRSKLNISQSEYGKLKTKGPLCD